MRPRAGARKFSGWFTLPFILFAPLAVEAQCDSDLTDRGVSAYRELQVDAAVDLLRRADVAQKGDAACDEQTRTLIYLGAAELLVGDRSAASSTFTTLVLADPGFRPDTLVFPPLVTQMYREVRASVPAASIRLPTDSTIVEGTGRIPIAILVSTPHTIEVELTGDGARDGRRIFTGTVADTLTLEWDGRSAEEGASEAGSYLLSVASLSPEGSAMRSISIPVEISRLPGVGGAADLREGRRGGLGKATISILAGALVATAAYFLPSALGGETIGDGAEGATWIGRLALAALGASLGVAGAIDHLSASEPAGSPSMAPTLVRIRTGDPQLTSPGRPNPGAGR